MRMAQTLRELGAGSVVLRAAKRTLLTGPAVLQQRVLRDLHTAYHAEEEKKVVDNEGESVEK
jgi:hypothetical protein